MVVVVETGRLQPSRLLVGQHAERGAGLEPHRFDALDHLAHLVEIAILGLAPGRAHAEAAGAGALRRPRLGQHRVERHQLLGLDAGVVMRALRAIGAVLRTAAGLDRQQRRDLHLGWDRNGAVDASARETSGRETAARTARAPPRASSRGGRRRGRRRAGDVRRSSAVIHGREGHCQDPLAFRKRISGNALEVAPLQSANSRSRYARSMSACVTGRQVVGVVDDLERGARDLLGEECRNALSGNPAAAARYQVNGTFQRPQCLHPRIGEGHLEVEDDLLRAPARSARAAIHPSHPKRRGLPSSR